MLATAGSISAIGWYEGVLLLVWWPIWVSSVGGLLAYLSEFCWWFVGVCEWVLLVICWPIGMLILLAVSTGNAAGWVEHRTILRSMVICNTVMTGSCTCMQSYCLSCSLLIKVPEWNVIFNSLIRSLWSAHSQLQFSFHTFSSTWSFSMQRCSHLFAKLLCVHTFCISTCWLIPFIFNLYV
jgi:hypothetical protein